MRFSAGDLVEASSTEDGLRGAYFSAKVLKKQRKGYLIEYKELLDDQDGIKPLKEKIDSLLLRPVPPQHNNESFQLYEEVDAYLNDGWWVGSVTKIQGSPPNAIYTVYFMHNREQMAFPISKLRPHLEFISGEWRGASQALLGVCCQNFKNLNNSNGKGILYIFPQCGEPRADVVPSASEELFGNKEGTKASKLQRVFNHSEGDNEDTLMESGICDPESKIESLLEKRKSFSRIANGRQRSTLDDGSSSATITDDKKTDERPMFFCSDISLSPLQDINQCGRLLHEELGRSVSTIQSEAPEITKELYEFRVPYLSCVQGSGGLLQGKASLRKLRLAAYHSVLQVLYFQGFHNWKYELLLTGLREALHISHEEHAAELRRLTRR